MAEPVSETAQAAHHLPVILSIVGGLGIFCQWFAWRFQLPAVVLLSLTGLALGPGLGILNPVEDFGPFLRSLVGIAVAVILFEGGLSLRFADLSGAGRAVRRLVLIGGPLAWIMGTAAGYYLAGLSLPSAAVLGGILVVTGPTVIAPLLRHARLSGKAGRTLQWEGIVNDPIGALFAVAAFAIVMALNDTQAWPAAIGYLILMAALGAISGIAYGLGLAHLFKRGLIAEYLKPPLILVSILILYAFGQWLEHEVGLVCVTALGMTLANARLASWHDLLRFKENIALLLISAVFILLCAGLTRELIAQSLNLQTLFFLVTMLFLVRPLSVTLAALGSGLSIKETALVAWIAPRGIVAVAMAGFFAAELAHIGIEDAATIAALAFAMSFVTVILHGFSIAPLSRALDLAHSGPQGILIAGATPWSIGLAKAMSQAGVDVAMADPSFKALREARQAGITTYHEDLLSESHGTHHIDHARYGQLLALTSNEYRNALLCSHFAPEFGRHNVYMISNRSEESDQGELDLAVRGRSLIRRGRNFSTLMRDFYGGWKFDVINVSAELAGDETFLSEKLNGLDFVALVEKDEAQVKFFGSGREPKLKEGASLILFGPDVRLDEISGDIAQVEQDNQGRSNEISDKDTSPA